MALIPIFPEDIKVNSVRVHPSQNFSSSSAGITGDVFLFAERPTSIKKISEGLEEYIFDIRESMDVSSGQVRNRDGRDQSSSSVDEDGMQNPTIEPQMQAFFDAVSPLSQSLENDKKLIVYRFNMPHRFNANTMRKSAYIKNLLPFYTGEYERPMNFGFTNYHSLNFFTSSAAHPSNVPSDSALIYPVPISGSKPSRYFASASFCYEFYINPRYTTDSSSDHYEPGTILHLPNCFAISLVSGSQKDELGRPTSFRLVIQLDTDSQRPTKMFNFNNANTDAGKAAQSNVTFPDGEGGSIVTKTHMSEDGHIIKDHWSYCAIRWGGQRQNNYTGNFYINGKKAGDFTIPGTEISLREKFSTLEDLPSALIVGNHYQATNSDIGADDDDRITILSGSAKNSNASITSGVGFMDVNIRQSASLKTRRIFLTTVDENAADTVYLQDSANSFVLATRLVNALNGDTVSRGSVEFTGPNNVGGQIKIEVSVNGGAVDTYLFSCVDSASHDFADLQDSEFRNSPKENSTSDLITKINSKAGLSTYVSARDDTNGKILLRAIPPAGGTVSVTLTDGATPLTKKNLINFSDNVKLNNVSNGFQASIINKNKNESVVDLDVASDYTVDILQTSATRVTPQQRKEGAQGNFVSEIFKVSSENSRFGNYNSTVNKTSFLFDSGSSSTNGVENLLDIETNENIRHIFDAPLNAELQEIRIFNRYRSDEEIDDTAINGYYSFSDPGMLFYLPPYFVPFTKRRRMLFTVSQSHFSSSFTPFNLNMSFGQGGRMINLENYTYDFVNMTQALCYNLSSTTPNGTFENFSEDDFDFIPATDAIYLRPENRKRNLTVLPSDLGDLDPKLGILDNRAVEIVSSLATEPNNTSAKDVKGKYFVDDAGLYSPGFVSLRNMMDLDADLKSSILTEADLDSEKFNINADGIASMLTPFEAAVARAAGFEEDQIGQMITVSNAQNIIARNDPSSVYGTQSAFTLTVLNRTRDPDSNEITFFDISNIFYGDLIKEESLDLSDMAVTGSAGKMQMKFKDNGKGNVYRCNSSGSHPIWASAGNILYEEGIVCLTNPSIPPFGVEQFNVKFKGQRNVHVLEMRVPISAEEAVSSSNPSFKPLAPTNLPSDSQLTCNLITNMNIHDENLNIIGKVNLSRPIVRKQNDKYVFKFKMDF